MCDPIGLVIARQPWGPVPVRRIESLHRGPRPPLSRGLAARVSLAADARASSLRGRIFEGSCRARPGLTPFGLPSKVPFDPTTDIPVMPPSTTGGSYPAPAFRLDSRRWMWGEVSVDVMPFPLLTQSFSSWAGRYTASDSCGLGIGAMSLYDPGACEAQHRHRSASPGHTPLVDSVHASEAPVLWAKPLLTRRVGPATRGQGRRTRTQTGTR